MSFRRGGAGKRRDAIEPAVIAAWRSVGVEVWQINGDGLPDVLTRHQDRWLPVGIKSGEKSRLTATERAGKAPWPLVSSVDDALALFGVVP